MYIKKIFITVIVFIISLFCFSFICSILYFILEGGNLFAKSLFTEDFFKIPLYMIGYGESPYINKYFKIIVCILGLIMVSILNAYLTVALFRSKKVEVTAGLERNDNKDYILLFTVKNNSKQIYNISLLFQVYIEQSNGEITEIGSRMFSKKIINSRGIWREKYKIQVGDFLSDFFDAFYGKKDNYKFQVVVDYLDNETGSQKIIAKEFIARDLITNSGYESSKEKKHGIEGKNTQEYNNKESMTDSYFRAFIDKKDKVIDLHKARKISGNSDVNAISITNGTIAHTKAINVFIDFSKKENFMPPDFLMALLEYYPCEDWSDLYKKNYSLEFDIKSTESVKMINLEIKSSDDGKLTKIVDREIETFQELNHISIKLQEIVSDADYLKKINEICFTCFSHNTNDPKGEFQIKDLKLVAGNDNAVDQASIGGSNPDDDSYGGSGVFDDSYEEQESKNRSVNV